MNPKNPIKLARTPVAPVKRRRALPPPSSSKAPLIAVALLFLIILGAVVIKSTSKQKAAPAAPEIARAPATTHAQQPAPQNRAGVTQNRKPMPQVPQEIPTALDTPAPLPEKSAPEVVTEAEIAKIDAEKLYLEYRQEELVKLPAPVLGKEVEVYYSNGDVMLQTPVAVDDQRGVVKMKMAYGAAEVHYSSFTRPCAEGYIPRLKAERIAQKRVSENLAAYIASTKAARHTSSQATSRSKNSRDPAVYFLPIPSSSSEDLLAPEQEMQAYLRVQARHSGQNFTVIHSSLEEDAAIVYLEVGPTFSKQNTGTRYQMTEGLRQFWGLRCMGNGVASDANAFLVLVSNGKIIGGSKVKESTSIWVR
jgi:hypothetical protein